MKISIGAVVLGTVLALGSAMPAAAQTLDSWGVKGGVNLAKLTFEGDEESADNKTGIVAGAYVKVAVNDMFSIQPEVLYSMKGGKFEEFGDEFTISINYIEVPILAHFDFKTSGSAMPFIAVGPTIGIKAKAKAELNGVEEDGFNDEVKSTEFGVALGGGVKINQITIEGRFSMSLSSIAKEGDSVKNRAISILVGWEFPVMR